MEPQEETTTDKTGKSYKLVRLSKNNLPDLTRLHNEVYCTDKSNEPFAKKYNTAYTGIENVGFLAYNEERPIAFYGVIPCLIRYGNQTIMAAQSTDTMTHPGFRYKGMFVELSKACFELCMELGIRVVFGFPNQNSYHGAVTKLGWKETEQMNCFNIPVKTLPLKAISKRLGLQNLYQSYAQKKLKKYAVDSKGVSNSVLLDKFAGIDRSEEYLNYKTFSETKVLAIAGTVVWCKIQSSLVIGDMERASVQNFDGLIKKLTRCCRWLGISQIQFHCCQGTTLHALFEKKYIASPSFPVLFQNFGSPIPIEKIKFTFADIDIF